MKTYSHPSIEEISIEKALHALSDPCRLKIVRTLLEADGHGLSCNAFSLEVSKSTASHHFDVLRDAGVTQTETEGTKCLTTLRKPEFDQKFPGLLQLVGAKSEAI